MTTDNYDSQNFEEPTPTVETPKEPVVTETEEGNPMLSALTNFMSQAKEFATLSKRVKALEDQVKSLTDQLTRVTSERDSLRAENGNIKDQLHVLKDENQYKSEVLERTRGQVSQWMRKYDEEHQALNKLREEHEHAKDDRDLAVLEVADWKRQYEEEKAHRETVERTSEADRTAWFDQENKLQAEVDKLTMERDRFRDKFDRCKSLAAQVMAMDQQRD